jgi:excisionase family DNA binding protein
MDQDHDRMTLSVTEAAKRLGISRAFAYELVARVSSHACVSGGAMSCRAGRSSGSSMLPRPTRDDSRLGVACDTEKCVYA